MKAQESGRASPKGRSARRQPNPLSTKAVQRDEGFGPRNRERISERRPQGGSEGSERNRIEGRFASFAGERSRLVLPNDPETRGLFQSLGFGGYLIGTRRSFASMDHPNRNRPGPHGLGRNRAGKGRGSDAPARTGPEERRSLASSRNPEPQRRRLALTQGLAVETGTVGAGRKVSPHFRLGHCAPA